MYEALWEDLWKKSASSGFRIRGIWIADVAWQGASGVLNEDKLGNDRVPLSSPPCYPGHGRPLTICLDSILARPCT